MNTKIILLLVIAIAFTIMGGCTSTTDPIIGSWQKGTEKYTVYFEFNPDHTFRQWSSDSPSIFTGSWKNEGSDWYSLATYSEGGTLGKTYLSTEDLIYDKTRDAIYFKGYPEGRFRRATQPLPPPPTPPTTIVTLRPEPIFISGDIIFRENPDTYLRVLILDYNPTTDEYRKVFIEQKDDGQWRCVFGALYNDTDSRGFVEKYYPKKYGHISRESVQDCYAATTTTTIS